MSSPVTASHDRASPCTSLCEESKQLTHPRRFAPSPTLQSKQDLFDELRETVIRHLSLQYLSRARRNQIRMFITHLSDLIKQLASSPAVSSDKLTSTPEWLSFLTKKSQELSECTSSRAYFTTDWKFHFVQQLTDIVNTVSSIIQQVLDQKPRPQMSFPSFSRGRKPGLIVEKSPTTDIIKQLEKMNISGVVLHDHVSVFTENDTQFEQLKEDCKTAGVKITRLETPLHLSKESGVLREGGVVDTDSKEMGSIGFFIDYSSRDFHLGLTAKHNDLRAYYPTKLNLSSEQLFDVAGIVTAVTEPHENIHQFTLPYSQKACADGSLIVEYEEGAYFTLGADKGDKVYLHGAASRIVCGSFYTLACVTFSHTDIDGKPSGNRYEDCVLLRSSGTGTTQSARRFRWCVLCGTHDSNEWRNVNVLRSYCHSCSSM